MYKLFFLGFLSLVLSGCGSGVPDTDDVTEAFLNDAKAKGYDMDKAKKEVEDIKINATCSKASESPLAIMMPPTEQSKLDDVFYCVVNTDNSSRIREILITKKKNGWTIVNP